MIVEIRFNLYNQVQPNTDAPSARNNHSTAVVDQKLMVHGGHDGNKWLADMYVLDTTVAQDSMYDKLKWQKANTSGGNEIVS